MLEKLLTVEEGLEGTAVWFYNRMQRITEHGQDMLSHDEVLEKRSTKRKIILNIRKT